MTRALVSACVALFLCSCNALAEPPQLRREIMHAHEFSRAWRETLVTLPITVGLFGGGRHATEFQLTYFRPEGNGPFPIAIVHHGRGPDRTYPSRMRTNPLVTFLLRRGFAVMVPTRVGFGGLGQRVDPERGIGRCDDGGLRLQIDAVDAHTLAVLEFSRSQSWVDPSRVLLAGVSVGGYASVAVAGRGRAGVIGVINFSGGSGGNPKTSPGKPCNPERIGRALAEAGKGERVPNLWIYAENDKYWGAQYPRDWHKLFVGAGGAGDFVRLPTLDDGHNTIGLGFAHWRKPVEQFLSRFGVQAPVMANGPPGSGFAALDDVGRLPGGSGPSDKLQAAYRAFLAQDVPRVFVISLDGRAWMWRSGTTETPQGTLAKCEELAKRACKVYAVDDRVVWTP
ncbi:MAG: hypothetical protein ABL898_17925 [Hyphomicrobiaceae bacterium]